MDHDDGLFASAALRWIDDVHRFSLSLTRNLADADDLVQDTYLRAHRSWHTFERGSDARAWLLTICRNAFIRTRDRARYRFETGDDIALIAEGMDVHAARSVEERLLTRLDLRPSICDALDQLLEPYRSVVVLVLLEDQSYESAATILGVPIGTVRSRLSRARQQLRRMLAPYQSVKPTMV